MNGIGHNSSSFDEGVPSDAPTQSDLAREFWAFVEVVRKSGLSHGARHVALDIWLHMRPGRLTAHPSVTRIAENTGLSVRSVRNSIRDLEEAGLFDVKVASGGRAKTNVYRAIIPEKTLSELAERMEETRQFEQETRQNLHQTRHTVPGIEKETRQIQQETRQFEQETRQNLHQNPAPVADEATLEATKELLRSEEQRSAPPSPPTAKRSGLVEVNCTSINGPGFVLPYGAIDMEATLRGVPIGRARELAASMAEGWAANKHRPGSRAMSEFIRALREEANDRAIQSVKMEKFTRSSSQNDGRPAGMPDHVWKQVCKDREAKRLSEWL